jgi:hypothetical protein
MLKQPGFIDWMGRNPQSNIERLGFSKKPIEWDGTMNMPILDLADPDHAMGSKVWQLK